MEKKLTATAYFMKDARRLGDLEERLRQGIQKMLIPQPYVVEKVVELAQIDYENFSEDLWVDRQFITDNLDLMFPDSGGVWHCILVVQAGKPDRGILVESKKREYPMYTALYREHLKIKL